MNEVRQIENAVRTYNAEYSRYPLPSGLPGADFWEAETNAEFMAILLGIDETSNPRRLRFYEGREARDGVDGLVFKASGMEAPALVDWWGNPYLIRIDANFDGSVGSIAGNGDGEIERGVVVWSTGPPDRNGSFGNPKHWIKSWE